MTPILKNEYEELLGVLGDAAMLCEPLFVFRDIPISNVKKWQRVFVDNPEYNSSPVLSQTLSGEWQKVKSFVPQDTNAPYYKGPNNKYITYQQCYDLSDAFTELDRALRQKTYSAYLTLQLADRAVRSLLPIDRYYGTLGSTHEAQETGTLTIAEDYFPNLAGRAELTVNDQTLYQISKAYFKGNELLEKIHHGLRNFVSPHLRESPFGTRSLMDPPEPKT